jgi:hypothetical protein
MTHHNQTKKVITWFLNFHIFSIGTKVWSSLIFQIFIQKISMQLSRFLFQENGNFAVNRNDTLQHVDMVLVDAQVPVHIEMNINIKISKFI